MPSLGGGCAQACGEAHRRLRWFVSREHSSRNEVHLQWAKELPWRGREEGESATGWSFSRRLESHAEEKVAWKGRGSASSVQRWHTSDELQNKALQPGMHVRFLCPEKKYSSVSYVQALGRILGQMGCGSAFHSSQSGRRKAYVNF